MPKPLRADEVFLIGTPTACDPGSIEQFERMIGVRPPRGYRDLLSRFGENRLDLGRSFFGLLAVLTPDQCLRHKQSQDAAARQYGLTGYFNGEGWPGYTDYFTPDDGKDLVAVATSVDAENIVFRPGLDELFYAPNPRSGRRIEVVGTELAAALAHFGRLHDFEIPFFVCGDGVHSTTVDAGGGHDWTQVLFPTTAPELVDERAWNYFYPHANACVHVEGNTITVSCGAAPTVRGEFLRWLEQLLANPPLVDEDD